LNGMRIAELDTTLRYHDLPGGEPTFLFLHGLGSASSSYFPRTAHDPRIRDHRCLLVDALGHGFSDRPAHFDYSMEKQTEYVARLLRSLDLRSTVAVGHSMGGAIAILLAAEHPELVAHLISAEGNLDPGPGFVSGPITSVSELEFSAFGHRDFVRKILCAGYSDYAGTVAIADPVGLYRSAVSLIAERRPTYRQRLYELSIARTYIFGARTLPDPDVDVLSAEGIDVRIVPAAGHDMMLDNPDGFAAAIADAVGASGRLP
jgi:haloalkane dehalogenase